MWEIGETSPAPARRCTLAGMQVELSPESVAAAEALVASGRCSNIDEAVRIAFWAFEESERRLDGFSAALDADPEWKAEVQRNIQEGLDDVEAGRITPADHEFFGSIKRHGRERLAQSRSIPA